MTLLTSAQRLLLINAAPSTHADHVITLDSAVYAIVRVDGLGRRIVALGTTAAEASERAKPTAPAATEPAAAPAASRRGARGGRGGAEKRKVDAEAFAAELAEYRRAVTAAGIERPELL
jgi:hypothetical protein